MKSLVFVICLFAFALCCPVDAQEAKAKPHNFHKDKKVKKEVKKEVKKVEKAVRICFIKIGDKTIKITLRGSKKAIDKAMAKEIVLRQKLTVVFQNVKRLQHSLKDLYKTSGIHCPKLEKAFAHWTKQTQAHQQSNIQRLQQLRKAHHAKVQKKEPAVKKDATPQEAAPVKPEEPTVAPTPVEPKPEAPTPVEPKPEAEKVLTPTVPIEPQPETVQPETPSEPAPTPAQPQESTQPEKK